LSRISNAVPELFVRVPITSIVSASSLPRVTSPWNVLVAKNVLAPASVAPPVTVSRETVVSPTFCTDNSPVAVFRNTLIWSAGGSAGAACPAKTTELLVTLRSPPLMVVALRTVNPCMLMTPSSASTSPSVMFLSTISNAVPVLFVREPSTSIVSTLSLPRVYCSTKSGCT